MKKYIVTFVVVFMGAILISSKYNQMTKVPTSAKTKRLPCHKHVTAFEKSYNKTLLQKAQESLYSGNVQFSSSIEKSIYAESKLFNFVDMKQMDKIFKEQLKQYIKSTKPPKDQIKLHYKIYESDVKNPGKKTKKSKLYAGYIILEVKNSKNQLIYKIQIDFMDKQGKDIPQTLECCIKSFATIAKPKQTME